VKIAVIGCGLRTPLLIHGLVNSGLDIKEIALFDTEPRHARIMAMLGWSLAEETSISVCATASADQAIANCAFVISSIRVGGMEMRARDERIALQHGFAGQETTGPAGFAMALRTVPVAISYARLVERLASDAWIVNFTNPAGLITQAILTHTKARAVGICDTPAELFFRIALALRVSLDRVECDYIGLNHLGWVRSVRVDQHDETRRLLADDQLLRQLYPADLFAPDLIRALELIPTEYVYFYYNQKRAYDNQRSADATRGEELLTLNRHVWSDLEEQIEHGNAAAALRVYRSYLNRRNASYMLLEGSAGSALTQEDPGWDPFAAATGYHRIAVETIRALTSTHKSRMALNVQNEGVIDQFGDEDVIEANCEVNNRGPNPIPVGAIPETVLGLMMAVKTFERLTIRAAVECSERLGMTALLANPIVRDWEIARMLTSQFWAP
jgi:6-phospho-beta-glucosidase